MNGKFNFYDNRGEKLRKELLQSIDERVTDFLSEVTQCQLNSKPSSSDFSEVNDSPGQHANGRINNGTSNIRTDNDLATKTFVMRESILTDLFRSSHIKSIYHIFIAGLVLMIFSSMLRDYFDKGTLDLKFEMIEHAFGKMPIVISMWLSMFLSTMALFAVFHYWATEQQSMIRFPNENVLWLSLYVGYLIAMVVYPLHYIVAYDLPVASSIIITCEQVRMLMKVHAFVRENIPRCVKFRREYFEKFGGRTTRIRSKSKDQQSDDVELQSPCPDFGKYLYFLFAPTLIYRDEYPRTTSISWKYVVTNIIQVIGCLFYMSYIFSHFLVPVFRDFNPESINKRTFLLGWFNCMLPGSLCLFIGFFAILHSWFNAFAEMLRFGDRLFYRDWWNSTSFSGYYRTWNVVVHDWLFTYVYRDVFAAIGKGKSRVSAMFSVFLLSAVFHEYILIVSFRFFYPVLFMQFFGIGFAMFFLTRNTISRGWNVFLWLCLFAGTGLFACLYSLEWYARSNCGPTYDNYLDFLIPRSWFCMHPKV